MWRNQRLLPPEDRGPYKVMFVLTSMPVGGAETLLVNLVRRMDRTRFQPELCCLKQFGPLGEVLASEIPAFEGLLSNKYDVGVFGRLTRLLRGTGPHRCGGDHQHGGRPDVLGTPGRLASRSAGDPVGPAFHGTAHESRIFQSPADSHFRRLYWRCQSPRSLPRRCRRLPRSQSVHRSEWGRYKGVCSKCVDQTKACEKSLVYHRRLRSP